MFMILLSLKIFISQYFFSHFVFCFKPKKIFFHWIGLLGRFSYRVDMSICVYVCLCVPLQNTHFQRLKKTSGLRAYRKFWPAMTQFFFLFHFQWNLFLIFLGVFGITLLWNTLLWASLLWIMEELATPPPSAPSPKRPKHRPSGPMLSISRNVRPSVRLCVCLCVCSLMRYHLTVFLPPLSEVGCPIFLEIQNPWGKVMERSGLKYEHFCLKIV